MGTWSTKLYGNDTISDVRDTYVKCLRETANDETAYKMTFDEYHELIDTDEEALFWFALADTQWKYGRLMSSVKNNALQFINKFRGEIPDQMNEKQATSWNNVLENLSSQLSSPQPVRKKSHRRECLLEIRGMLEIYMRIDSILKKVRPLIFMGNILFSKKLGTHSRLTI